MVSQALSTSGNIIIFRAAGVVAPVVNPIHFEAAGQICTAEGNIFLRPDSISCAPLQCHRFFSIWSHKGITTATSHRGQVHIRQVRCKRISNHNQEGRNETGKNLFPLCVDSWSFWGCP